MKKNKCSQGKLSEVWNQSTPNKSHQYADVFNYVEPIIFDYAVRMCGQVSPLSESIENIRLSLTQDALEYSNPKELLMGLISLVRKQNSDIWMANTDALINPLLDMDEHKSPFTKDYKFLEQEVNRLYPHAKELLLLHYWFDLPIAEISVIVGQNEIQLQKLLEQAQTYIANKWMGKDLLYDHALLTLPLHESPLLSRHETQDLGKLMEGLDKEGLIKRSFKISWRLLVVVVGSVIISAVVSEGFRDKLLKFLNF